jgi:hypothetical protein
MLMSMLAGVQTSGSMFFMPAQKAAKPRIIVEVTEDEQADLKALAFIRSTPIAQIVRGLLKVELARHRTEIDKAKKLIGARR